MGESQRVRRHRFENQTSDIARQLELPTDEPHGAKLKNLLRGFLAVLGEIARRLES